MEAFSHKNVHIIWPLSVFCGLTLPLALSCGEPGGFGGPSLWEMTGRPKDTCAPFSLSVCGCVQLGSGPLLTVAAAHRPVRSSVGATAPVSCSAQDRLSRPNLPVTCSDNVLVTHSDKEVFFTKKTQMNQNLFFFFCCFLKFYFFSVLCIFVFLTRLSHLGLGAGTRHHDHTGSTCRPPAWRPLCGLGSGVASPGRRAAAATAVSSPRSPWEAGKEPLLLSISAVCGRCGRRGPAPGLRHCCRVSEFPGGHSEREGCRVSCSTGCALSLGPRERPCLGRCDSRVRCGTPVTAATSAARVGGAGITFPL